MGPLLKALGVTIWGLVALGLLAVFIFVGYQAAVRSRDPGAAVADIPSTPVQRNANLESAHTDGNTATQALPELKNLDSASKSPTWQAIRKRFREAAEQRRFATVLDAGKQLYDAGLADPDDLLVIAHAFTSIGDCGNALIWAERANDALRTVGAEPNGLSERIRRQCKSGAPPLNLARNSGTANTPLANRFIRIGEVYYGFGDYPQAITAIQRGLDIGGASHLDEAYVYLGLAELRLNNVESACRAFQSLNNIPNISPRILKLWTLFADMRC